MSSAVDAPYCVEVIISDMGNGFYFWVYGRFPNVEIKFELIMPKSQLTDMALEILGNNVQLKDVTGDDPLCATSTIYTQGRQERNRGKLLEAMTIRVRPVLFASE